MKQQVIEILKEHYGEIDIIDFEVEYQGALLTNVVLTKDEENESQGKDYNRGWCCGY